MIQNILIIILILLYSLHDYYVIGSYSKAKFKRYWHFAKFIIVALTGYLIFGFSKELIAFYLLFYVIFESVLNILRKKPLLYVSKNGSFSDKLRTQLFGEHVTVYEGIIKVMCIIIAIILLR